MLESFSFSVVIGIALGFLSGLGIGGGSLLILWLTLVLGVEQEVARGVNLMFFLPSAIIACLFRFRQGTLELRRILPAIAAGIIGAVVFSLIGSNMDTALLRKPFGVLLLVTGLREIFYRQRKAR